MAAMRLCLCDRNHLDEMYGKRGGPFFCSNCKGMLMCYFGEEPHAANIVMINSYACREHVKEALAKEEEEE